MMRVTPLLLTAVVLILVTVPAPSSAAEKLPHFVARDLESRTIDSSDLQGKVLILNFWASWCSPCRKEMPELQLLYEKYKDKGVSMIGVSMDDSVDAARKFLTISVVQYPTLMWIPALERLRGADAVPTTLIFDRTGKVRAERVGYADRKWHESKIQKLLMESMNLQSKGASK